MFEHYNLLHRLLESLLWSIQQRNCMTKILQLALASAHGFYVIFHLLRFEIYK